MTDTTNVTLVEDEKLPIEISIEDGTITTPPAKTDDKPVDDDATSALKQQIERHRQATRDAQAAQAEADRRRQQAEARLGDSQKDVVSNAIDAVTREAETAERDYAAAMEKQDFAGAAKLQRTMAQAEAKLLRLRESQADIETRKPVEGRVEVRQETPADPVEAVARNLSAKSGEWLRAHPECIRDPSLKKKMLAAHYAAEADDIVVDSDEYFAHLNDKLGFSERRQEAPVARQTQSGPAAAPPSRSPIGSDGRQSNPNVVTLTASERETAKLMGLTDKEYAISKRDLQKEGLID